MKSLNWSADDQNKELLRIFVKDVLSRDPKDSIDSIECKSKNKSKSKSKVDSINKDKDKGQNKDEDMKKDKKDTLEPVVPVAKSFYIISYNSRYIIVFIICILLAMMAYQVTRYCGHGTSFEIAWVINTAFVVIILFFFVFYFLSCFSFKCSCVMNLMNVIKEEGKGKDKYKDKYNRVRQMEMETGINKEKEMEISAFRSVKDIEKNGFFTATETENSTFRIVKDKNKDEDNDIEMNIEMNIEKNMNIEKDNVKDIEKNGFFTATETENSTFRIVNDKDKDEDEAVEMATEKQEKNEDEI